MYDIKLYQLTYGLKDLLKEKILTKEDAVSMLNTHRKKYPVIYNIETTNICNQTCAMCPRTTQMTRKLGTMKMPLFEKIVKQIKPWNDKEWNEWTTFVQNIVGIKENEMSENHFFYCIIPKVITLHGFGEPLLDKHIVERVKLLTKHHIPSYFSCHPKNFDYEQGLKLAKAGLSYLKISSEKINDFDDYTKFEINSFIFAIPLLNGKTKVVIDVVGDQTALKKLQKWFPKAYVYVKSQDNQWYAGTKKKTPVAHLSGPCQFPWSSLTILWNGDVVPCNQDFNAEMKLGDATTQSLWEIWNSKKYKDFRMLHLKLDKPLKCIDKCDMNCLVGEL